MIFFRISGLTMKILALHRITLLAGSLACLGSCSVPLGGGKPRLAATLSPGQTYELRSALGTSSDHEPNGMRSMYFVLRPEAPPEVGGRRLAMAGPLAVRTTAYTHSESDHLIYGRRNAVGGLLKYGTIRSAAADWSRYPLGTKFRIKGQPTVIYEVDDYGSALVGTNTIDLYCPTKGLMNHWGVRNVGVEVIQWGSFARSAYLMKDRVHYPHVRRMMNDIKSRNLVETELRESSPSKDSGSRSRKSPPKLNPQGPLRLEYLTML